MGDVNNKNVWWYTSCIWALVHQPNHSIPLPLVHSTCMVWSHSPTLLSQHLLTYGIYYQEAKSLQWMEKLPPTGSLSVMNHPDLEIYYRSFIIVGSKCGNSLFNSTVGDLHQKDYSCWRRQLATTFTRAIRHGQWMVMLPAMSTLWKNNSKTPNIPVSLHVMIFEGNMLTRKWGESPEYCSEVFNIKPKQKGSWFIMLYDIQHLSARSLMRSGVTLTLMLNFRKWHKRNRKHLINRWRGF